MNDKKLSRRAYEDTIHGVIRRLGVIAVQNNITHMDMYDYEGDEGRLEIRTGDTKTEQRGLRSLTPFEPFRSVEEAQAVRVFREIVREMKVLAETISSKNHKVAYCAWDNIISIECTFDVFSSVVKLGGLCIQAESDDFWMVSAEDKDAGCRFTCLMCYEEVGEILSTVGLELN